LFLPDPDPGYGIRYLFTHSGSLIPDPEAKIANHTQRVAGRFFLLAAGNSLQGGRLGLLAAGNSLQGGLLGLLAAGISLQGGRLGLLAALSAPRFGLIPCTDHLK